MLAEIAEADRRATEDRHSIEILTSRQDYYDLLSCFRKLRDNFQNPTDKACAKRIEKIALRIRDGLDRKGVP